MLRATFLTILLVAGTLAAQAGGVRGTITSDEGEILAYATIYVQQTGSGTTTNEEGAYEITLPNGHYTLVFQHLGYETVSREVDVLNEVLVLNIVLKQQTVMLRQVTVTAGAEDPAYTIMRKAIAMAAYHDQQIDDYTATVYIKGEGQLKDYPWFAKRTLEKQNIEKNRVFISESVSNLHYRRPDTYEEHVVSIRSDGKDNNTSPNEYIFGSFYKPEIAETISPLSPHAFAYYCFEYLGSFKDRGYTVSQIKVTPRTVGDNTVEGTLNIIEDQWCIHSLDFHTTRLGVSINLKQIYEPIVDGPPPPEGTAWLPVSDRFDIGGKFFGFDFVYNYVATVSDYRINLNPDLVVDSIRIIDDKVDKAQAQQIESSHDDKRIGLQERLESGKEITRKEMRSLMKDYAKDERKEEDHPEVIAANTFRIDSGAYKKDSAYWSTIRPVPLTAAEIKGYAKTDSLAEIERRKEAGDTLKSHNGKFNPWDLLIGDSYKLTAHSNFQIDTPLPDFNTVEGWNFVYRLRYGVFLRDTNRTRINVSPVFRYSFARKKADGWLDLNYRNRKQGAEISAGRYIRQLNPDEPINPILNGLTTLLLEENYMKLYENDFLDLNLHRRVNPFLTAETHWRWEERYHLDNHSDFKIINRASVPDYTSNDPTNVELSNTAFPTHRAFTGDFSLTARPWQKFRERNGHRWPVEGSSPSFTVTYRKAFPGVAGSAIDFSQLEIGYNQTIRFGLRGTLRLHADAGKFLNPDSLSFIDYKHFPGNETPVMTTDPVSSFRLLNYYGNSTANQYFAAAAHFQFRRFLVSRIIKLQLLGVREDLFTSYLHTPAAGNYLEAGYAVDGLLRFLRIEVAASFQNGKYQNTGLRFGITSSLAIRFAD